jgi:hypothetical protein
MSEQIDRDPLEELGRANPVPDVDQLPSASLARVRARVMEDVMSDTDTAPSRPGWVGPAIVGLAGTLAGLAIVVALLGSPSAPGVISGPSTGPQVGACVETYSLETLRNRSFAFDGTVAAVTGDQVTFRVTDAFRGATSGEVTLTATGMTGTAITPGGGPTLVVGGRYLVAGDDRFVWACGFTQPYDPAVAADWSTSLDG